jgi:hypothetical protein
MKTAYTYTTLRYVHDIAAGEFLNVGVVLLAPACRYLEARIQTNIGRVRKAFPAVDGDAHKELMRYLQTCFDARQTQMSEELPYEPLPRDAGVVAAHILPKDDSSLQWSPLGSGLTADPAAELTRLYARLVTANEGPKNETGRGDDVIWSVYRAPLLRDKVLPYLQPHKVVAENDEVEFEHAWKNDSWHCLEPFSLDYLNAESIKDKAHRLLGQMAGVKRVIQNHRLYLMVGEPQIEKYKAPAERYLNLLAKELPLPTEIIREDQAEQFSRDFAKKIQEHVLSGSALER